MRQRLVDPLLANFGRWRKHNIWLGHHLVNVINVQEELRRLPLTRLWQWNAEIGANVGGIASQHDNPVGQQHSLFNIVGNNKNCFRVNFLVEPELQQ